MKILTFGEIMLRLKTPENLRILQAQDFEASYGGAEANVAVSLAMMEDPESIILKKEPISGLQMWYMTGPIVLLPRLPRRNFTGRNF